MENIHKFGAKYELRILTKTNDISDTAAVSYRLVYEGGPVITGAHLKHFVILRHIKNNAYRHI